MRNFFSEMVLFFDYCSKMLTFSFLVVVACPRECVERSENCDWQSGQYFRPLHNCLVRVFGFLIPPAVSSSPAVMKE